MTDTPINSANEATRTHHDDSRVGLVLDQYLEDLQNGRAGSREELLEQHPDLKEALIDCLDSIEMVAGLGVGNELVPQRLGDFEIIKPIGRGAMGVVYLANQISLKRQVALKVLRYTAVGHHATKRFEREAELVATLQHTNIVPIYATGQQDSSHYLAMQLIDGPSLSQWSAGEQVNRDPKTIAKWGIQIAQALAHAHQQGVIHRDVKPSNLLFDDGHVWLTDFGLARRYDDVRMSMTGAMLGTPNYMSPEQAAPNRYPLDFRSDIYSLGASLFELLTGRCVFVAETPHAALAQVISEEPQPLRELVPDASRDLETILLKCLEKEPAARYQSAEDLADDLAAFAEDRSIKARRPNVIERANRWKRKNQKVVSAAAFAAAAAVMLLATTLAIWIAWKDSITGTIEIASNEGPIVGRLVDDSGTASPTFSIPTDRPLRFAAGDYTLQTWSGGRLGDSQRITVAAKQSAQLNTNLANESVFDERTVRGIPKALPLGDRDDLLFFHEDGITRMDGRNGKELWTAEADRFKKSVSKSLFKKLVAKNKANEEKLDEAVDEASLNLDNVLTFNWKSAFNSIVSFDSEGSHNNQRIPFVAEGFPDINGDGQPDVMIACRKQTVLLAFNGKTGSLLWYYHAGGTSVIKTTLHKPIPLGDIDSDNVADFGCMFYTSDSGKKPRRWMDAVSGKTGKRIWRRSMPKEWFDTPANVLRPSFCQVDTMRGISCEFAGLRIRGNQWAYRSHKFKKKTNGDLVPWKASFVSDLSSDSGSQLLIVCGSQIVSVDPGTGEAGSFNAGQPLDLGFVPALQPQVVHLNNSDPKVTGLLLTEVVATSDRSKRTKAVTRFSMRSLDDGEELWHFDAGCEPEWLGSHPDWPIVADLNGDLVPEILIADGASLASRHPNALSSMQVLDGRTGKPLWDATERAEIRSHDRQIQYALIGPDEDGDQFDDIYVVSPMVNSRCWVFVDVLSGVSGKRIRTVSSDVPIFKTHNNGLFFERPFFLGNRMDGQRLVISTKATDLTYQRESTVVMSMATGGLTNVGDQLEHPVWADGDGDGQDDLFLLKPRVRSKLAKSSQLVSLKSSSGGSKFNSAEKITLIDDVDGDGVRDLLDAPFGQYIQHRNYADVRARRVLSGASGKRLFEWEYQKHAVSMRAIHGDIDGDGIHDYLAEKQLTHREDVALLTLISGATGKALWEKETVVMAYTNGTLKCHDMDLDGRPELLIFHHFGDNNNTPSRFRLTSVDGKSGDDIWHFDVATPDSKPGDYTFGNKDYEFRILDVNGDGSPDVVCPFFEGSSMSSVAINGKNGKPIWRLPRQPSDVGIWMTHWHSEVVSSGEKGESVFATAWQGKNQKGKAEVTVDFFDLATGVQVATWTGAGKLSSNGRSSRERSRTEGVPLGITNGKKTYVGIVLSVNHTKELVVLDFSTADPTSARSTTAVAKEVRRIVSGDLILVDDFSDDGKTDGVFLHKKQLVTFDLASGKETNRKVFTAAQNALSMADDSEDKLILVETEDGPNRRAKLVDPATLDVEWDLNWPRDTVFSGLLCGDCLGPDHSNDHEFSIAPCVLFSTTQMGAIVVTASRQEFTGGDELFASRFRSRHRSADASDVAMFDDPRMIEPLPWNLFGDQIGVMEVEGLKYSPIVMLTQVFPIVLGAIVFPVWMVVTTIRRRQWTLKWVLLLPLAFVLPYVLLQLPSPLDAEFADDPSVPFWWGKFIASMRVVPFLMFIGVFAKHWFSGNWKMIYILSAFVFLIPGLMAASELASTPMHPDSRYDWMDPGSIWLLWAGIWFVGMGVMVKWLYASAASVALWLFRSLRIVQRPAVL